MSAYFGDAVFSVADPKCEREEEARNGGWSIDSSDAPTLKWCLGMDQGDRVLNIANNRHYPLIIEVPRNVTLRSRSDRGFAARVSEAALRDDWIVLDGGGTASWTLNQEEGSTIKFRTDFDGLAQAVTSIEVSANWLATLLTKVPGGKSGGKAALLTLIESSGCLRVLIDNTDSQNAFGAEDVAKLVTSCLSFETLTKFAGRTGAAILLAPVGLVLGTGNYFVGAWEGLTNSISGKVNYKITISRTAQKPERLFDTFDSAEAMVDSFVPAWVANDRARLGRIPGASALEATLPAAPSRSWITECDESAGRCSVQFGEDNAENLATLAWFDIEVELGDVSGWNIMSVTRTL